MTLRLRPAEQRDVAQLEHWDEQPHVVAAGGDDDVMAWADEIEAAAAWQEILVAELDGRPIGVVVIIDPALEASHYWGEVPAGLRAIDIWIGEADEIGRGHGTQMMSEALDRCFDAPDVGAVLIDPLVGNVAAQRFYRRLGFADVGERTFGSDRCLVMRLPREAWEQRRATLDPPRSPH